MNDQTWLAEHFEADRGHLRAIAYRMLGSRIGADDAVQETWLRLSRADAHAIDDLRAWLTRVVAQVCLDVLSSRASCRETPLDAHLPGAVDPDDAINPQEEVVGVDPVGVAMLAVLETLTPAERLVFVLHDMFAVPFEEIATMLARSPAATREVASQARRRVRGERRVLDGER